MVFEVKYSKYTLFRPHPAFDSKPQRRRGFEKTRIRVIADERNGLISTVIIGNGVYEDWRANDLNCHRVGRPSRFGTLCLCRSGKICSKVGYSRWLGLVMAIPFVNIVALIMFAYSTWPIELKLMGSESKEAPLAEKHGYLRGPRDRAPF